MKIRSLALIVLVVGALPAASATDLTSLNESESVVQDTATNETETNVTPVSSPADADSAGDADSGSDADSAAGSNDDSSDYTKLLVESDYDHPELKPGESTEFNVTVTNREESAVDLDPHVYVPPVGENLLEKSWVTIDGDSTVAAGEETEFTVSIDVPDDAETGYHSGQVAFTDEKVTYPGRPERPVHAASVNVRVWKQPMVEIVSSTYLNDQVEAGDTTTSQIVVENTGDEAVPLSPQLKSERNRISGGGSSSIDPAWVDVESPSSVEPGEKATVTVTVAPSESADSNSYRGELDLGLKDPNRDDSNSYWQRVSLNVDVWNQPEEPYETSFDVSEDTDNVTLTLSPRAGYGSGSDSEPADFDVTFVDPEGTAVSAERVQVTDRGTVDMSDTNSPNVQQQGEYAVRTGGQELVYRIDDPEAGSWDLRLVPENVIGFEYEITRNESPQ